MFNPDSILCRITSHFSMNRFAHFLGIFMVLPIASISQTLLSPADFHGYELGTTYTITANHFNYYKHLAENSNHVEYLEYGTSIQNRPLVSLMVSSEENLKNRDAIKQSNRELTQVISAHPQATLDKLLADTKGIIWIFIVDTDEEAGVEVLSEVAYDLATRQDEVARKIRDNLIVIFSPLTNPDSHARYVTWHRIYDVNGASNDPLCRGKPASLGHEYRR